MAEDSDTANGRRSVRERIEDALFDALAAGEIDRVNHDRLAVRTGIGRRTVYRYFPDRRALMEALAARLLRTASATDVMPKSEVSLLAGLDDLYRGFDADAAVTMVTMASAEGRAARNATTPERARAYRAAMADATRGLSGPDRTQATAIVQLLYSGLAWREMRDQWHLPGNEIAAACRWAIEVLLTDLRARKGKPLADGSARQGILF